MRDGAVGVDLYNAQVTGGVSVTLRLGSSDADHVPCVIVSPSAPQTQERADEESQSRYATRSTSLPVPLKEY